MLWVCSVKDNLELKDAATSLGWLKVEELSGVSVSQPFCSLGHPIPSLQPQWENRQTRPSLFRGTWFYLASGIVISGNGKAHINANAHGNEI